MTALKPDDIARVREARRILHDVLPIVDKAENCGVACEAYRALIKQLTEQLEAMERDFGNPVDDVPLITPSRFDGEDKSIASASASCGCDDKP